MRSHKQKSAWRWLLRGVVALFITTSMACVVGIIFAWIPMGKAPSGARAVRVETSPNWFDGGFANPQPMYQDYWGSLTAMFELSEHAVPDEPLPVEEGAQAKLESKPRGPRVTWLGHSTVLIEIAGKRVLTDPVFGERTSPISALGPKRWYPPPVPLEALEGVDLVVISHDHYDHLDQPTIERMKAWDMTFVAPLGIGAHLEYWGVDPARIVELDWWEEYRVDALRVMATPARHASGRHLFDQNRTLWAGYAIIGPEHRVMFSGDTGLFDDMALIGERFGPFDLVMIEVGAYHRAWPDWHIGPEQAMTAHEMMRGQLFMPIHWGLFNLAMHGWTEPVERAWLAAERAGVTMVVPRPGQPFELGDPPELERWWPELPWDSADEHPIVSTRAGDPSVRY